MVFALRLMFVNATMAIQDLDVTYVLYKLIEKIYFIALKSPFCVNGIASNKDTCLCKPGWKGLLCEISNCVILINSRTMYQLS